MIDPDDIPSNHSPNEHLAELVATRLSRRALIAGGGALGAVAFLGRGTAFAAPPATTTHPHDKHRHSLLGFEAIPPSSADDIVVPPGYTAQVLIPWGTPLVEGVEWQEDASNTSADQEKQVGFNHDGIHFFPLDGHGSKRGLLVLNHEYTDASQIYTAAQGSSITADAAGIEKVNKALAGHGVTVVEVRRNRDGSWRHVVGSRYNRRVTGATPVGFSGPVQASHSMLSSSVTPDPLGTLNNCGHGYTPWGTYLAAEENWNGYFGTDSAFTATTLESRYGVSSSGFGYNWHKASARFDLAQNRNEVNRFGWIVEIDPKRPNATPVKRTALGRFKHEGACVIEAKGRVVVYSGDDENGEYLYKFIGDKPWHKHRSKGRSPLDHGKLYVAKFDADGNGAWLPLVHGEGPLTIGNGWADQADVLIRTRQAADAVGATKCHRPEWVAVNSKTDDVFVTFTNGSGNSAPVNSNRDPNPYGHIVRLREKRRDATELTFRWDVFMMGGDPAYDASIPGSQEIFGSPDGLWVDDDGRMWIQTDISNSSQNRPDRGYDHIGNNQMLACDPRTGEVKRFLTGPRGCEITGVITTPDQRTMFVNVQHPGESTTYWNNLNGGAPSTSNPTKVSTWPYHGGRRPRSATVVIRRVDGRRIGE